jgi:uncharacterized protein (TIGR00251 family)
MTPRRGETATSALPPWIRVGGVAITVDVLARPGAAHTAILRVEPRGIVLAVAAPADKGKANQELTRFIAKLAGVTRGSVEIVRGATSRSKVIRISTADPRGVCARLLASTQQE